MTEPESARADAQYKTTLGDRLGPDLGLALRGVAFGLLICSVTFGVMLLVSGFHFHWWQLPVAVIASVFGAGLGRLFSESVGAGWRQIFVGGASTPYVEQYSFQQALVMQGRAAEAVASFEGIVLREPAAVLPRMKLAELLVAERDHRRAAEVFRSVTQIDGVRLGECALATNRLVDLLLGPLEDPGRAMVELRRLIERYPSSLAASHARSALGVIKSRTTFGDGASGHAG